MTFPHIEFAAKSDCGRKRANNEDAFGAFPEAGVFCVADGMGGGDDGEIASTAVVNAVKEFAASHTPPTGAGYAGDDLADGISEALNRASYWVFRRSEERQLKGCGSTFAGFCLDATAPGSAIALHAGDSRLYRIRGRGIKQVTRDHSAAEMIGAKGDAAINPMFRGMILRAVGLKPTVEVERTPLALKEGDRLVVCSDGLSGMVDDEDIADIVRSCGSPAEAADALVAAANDAGGLDNVTAVVVFVGKLPLPLPEAAFPSEESSEALSGDDTGSGWDSSTAGTGSGEGFVPGTDSAARDAEEAVTADSAPPTPPTTSTAGNPEETRKRMLSRRRSRRIRSIALKFAAGTAVAAVAAGLCVVLEKRRSTAARDREAERIKSVRILAEMNQSDPAQQSEATGPAAEPRQESTSAHVESAGADSAEDWASEVLPLLVEACAPSNSAEFVKTVRRFPGNGMVESLKMRFRPMCDATLPLERRKGIAAAIAADVQDIARGLRARSKRRIEQIDAALAEHTTRAEFKEALLSERKGLESFMEASEKLASVQPGTSRAQAVCAEMLVGMPTWFRQVK